MFGGYAEASASAYESDDIERWEDAASVVRGLVGTEGALGQ